MSKTVIYLTPDSNVDDAMSIMTEKRIRHLPVLADNVVLGVLSIGDLVKAKAKTHELHIRTLEAYVGNGSIPKSIEVGDSPRIRDADRWHSRGGGCPAFT